MTPGTFNRKRFAALCRLDWAEKRKSYLLFLLIFYVVTAIIITYNSLHIYYDMSLIGDRIATTVPLPPGADRSWDRHLSYLVVSFFVFMLLATRQTHGIVLGFGCQSNARERFDGFLACGFLIFAAYDHLAEHDVFEHRLVRP